MKVTNHIARNLGVNLGGEIVSFPGSQTVDVAERHIAALVKNKTFMAWIASGSLSSGVISKSEDFTPLTFTPQTGKGEIVEVRHVGRGAYNVFVDGVKLQDENMTKEAAEAMKVEYVGG